MKSASVAAPVSLLLATRNVHKTREFAEILGLGFRVSDLTSHTHLATVHEDGHTFEANAILKAQPKDLGELSRFVHVAGREEE